MTENKLLTSNVKKYSLIYSNHFNADVFISYKHTRLLEKSAVPNIIISRVKYVKVKFPEYAIPTTTVPNVIINQLLLKMMKF